MLVWKDEYSIGVDLIDKQHKYLFEIGNSAYKLLRDDTCVDKYDGIGIIIQDLHQYAKFHFKTEEEYLIKINSKKYFSQKLAHDNFIQKIDNIDIKYVEKDPEKYIEDILSFVFNWLLGHILLEDKLIETE